MLDGSAFSNVEDLQARYEERRRDDELKSHMLNEGRAKLNDVQQSQERLRAENAALRSELDNLTHATQAKLAEMQQRFLEDLNVSILRCNE